MENFKDDQGEESRMTLKRGLKDLSENVGELLEKAQMAGTTLT
jgi:hypothetical protein